MQRKAKTVHSICTIMAFVNLYELKYYATAFSFTFSIS